MGGLYYIMKEFGNEGWKYLHYDDNKNEILWMTTDYVVSKKNYTDAKKLQEKYGGELVQA